MKQCASAVALVLAVACSSLAHLFLLKMLSCHLNNRHPSWGGRCPARAASCACPTATERATDARIYVPIGHGVAPTTRTATRSMSRGRSVTGVGGCSSGHDELPLSSGHARHTAQQRWPPAKVEGAASPAAGGGDGGSSSGQTQPFRHRHSAAAAQPLLPRRRRPTADAPLPPPGRCRPPTAAANRRHHHPSRLPPTAARRCCRRRRHPEHVARHQRSTALSKLRPPPPARPSVHASR